MTRTPRRSTTLRGMPAATVKVGIFGGAFDPPTTGHLRCIREAFASGNRMDKVFVIPSGERTDKPNQTAYHHRFAMCSKAFGAIPNVLVGSWEAPEQRKGPIYTFDTMVILKKLYPWWDFYLVLGSDYGEGSTVHWHRGEELLQMTKGIITVPRSEENSTALRANFNPQWVDPQVAQYAADHNLYQST